jgi:heme/copper-type cytochrome/quinol oxidase subunit 4
VRSLVRTAVTPVWFFLVLATAVSWWLGADQGLGADAHEIATVLVICVAFIKVGFVGMYFMELRHAPRALRLIFQAWCTIVSVVLVLIYLVGT